MRLWTVVGSVCLLSACGFGEAEVLDDVDRGTAADVERELAGTCGAVPSGMTLEPGAVINDCSTQYRLIMQGDGNLVLYASNPTRPIWASNTFVGGSRVVMQSDGNLVLYSPSNQPLWASGTNGRPDAWLSVQSDGNLVIRDPAGNPVWASNSRQCGALYGGGQLTAAQQLSSCNDKYFLAMQADANLVVYQRSPQVPVWSSQTNRANGAGVFAVMQGDGNFVVYQDGRALWHSQTNGNPGSALLLRDDGSLAVATPSRKLVWASNGVGVGDDDAPVGPVPASLVSRLSGTPYVEQRCSPTSYPGWPHAAKRCTYTSGGRTTSVTVANPSPQRVASWVVDSANQIPSLAALRTSSPGHYEQGLLALASVSINASSRIFPLEGGVLEDMDGDGAYENFYFLKGVTRSCSGCYCRINSLTRGGLCNYRNAKGLESYGACMGRIGGSGYTEAWGNQCLKNHADSFDREWNEHFRARAWGTAQGMGNCARAGACTPDQVVSAIRRNL